MVIGIKENDGVNSNMTYLIYCKSFCGCPNVLLLSITIKKDKKKSEINEIIRA
jgi:hypothetical protein